MISTHADFVQLYIILSVSVETFSRAKHSMFVILLQAITEIQNTIRISSFVEDSPLKSAVVFGLSVAGRRVQVTEYTIDM
jgi:hypothetical protein